MNGQQMDDLTTRALLFDFYGSLLTEKQREIYDLYYQQDLSLGEISVLQGVSRTAVFDLVKRTDLALNHYEERLCLVQKYLTGREITGELQQSLTRIKQLTQDCPGLQDCSESLWARVSNLLQKLEDSW